MPSPRSGRVASEFIDPQELSVKCVEDGSGTVRVKIVISKRELEALLSDRRIGEKSLLLQLKPNGANIK